jgi:hypothetical protein
LRIKKQEARLNLHEHGDDDDDDDEFLMLDRYVKAQVSAEICW